MDPSTLDVTRRTRARVPVCSGLLAVAAALAAPAAQPAASDTGAVVGVVRLASTSSQRLATPGAYPGRRVTVVPRRESSELQNVVVFIRRGRPEPAKPITVQMRQTAEAFVPHVVAISTGSTVEFPNDDLVFHNVFSLSSAATFDLGRYPQHASKSRAFTKPGIVKVYCHLHSHMSALVRVFDHPYFVIPGPDGRFVIEGLEPGRHDVKAWHERVGETGTSVVVAAGQRTEVSLALPLIE